MTIGEKIKIARCNARLTQRALAEKCGIATGTVQQYELGKRQPRIEQLLKIAEALNISPIHFLNDEEIQELKKPHTVDGKMVFLDPDYIDAHRLSPYDYRARMLSAFEQMSEEGQKVAAERVEELAENPKYQKKED